MISLTTKIVLAACAFTLAILQISDQKSLSDQANGKWSFWRRLTKFGILRLVIACATLALIGVNEIIGYNAKQAQMAVSEEKQADSERQMDEANAKLRATETLVSNVFQQNNFLLLQNEQLRSVLDKSQVIGTQTQIKFEILNEGSRLLFEGRNRASKPRKGDVIEWQITCPIRPPISLTTLNDTVCSGDGYGALIAFSQVVILDSLSGKKRLSGTLSNDADMVYRSPGLYCQKVLSSLKSGGCLADLTFWRTGASEILSQDQIRSERPKFDLSPKAKIACQNYERLTGKACEEFLANQDN